MSGQKSDFECFCKLNNSIYALGGSDRENFTSLLETAYQYPKGRETMNAVAFQGYKFMYQPMVGVNGACDYDHKFVNLDSYHRQTDLVPILIHESTHIRQIDRLIENTGNGNPGDFIAGLNAYDFIKLNRALEADACAHQAAVAYQMRNDYPQTFEKEMQTPMMRAYVDEMEKSGDETKAMRSSFEAWYGYKNYQDSYEKMYVPQIKNNAEKKAGNGAHTLTLSSDRIVALCLHDGKSYIAASFLDRAENMAVSEKGKEALKQTGDKSVDRLPVRGERANAVPAPILLKAAALAKGR